MNERIERALEGLKPALEADGFELRLESVHDDGTVNVALEAKPDACMDCLVPDETLIAILEQAIRVQEPSVQRVILNKYHF